MRDTTRRDPTSPCATGVQPSNDRVQSIACRYYPTISAPSTQWWIALSSAIVFGLAFSTVLTLIVTPSMLMIFTRAHNKGEKRGFFARLFRRKPKTAPPIEAMPEAAE